MLEVIIYGKDVLKIGFILFCVCIVCGGFIFAASRLVGDKPVSLKFAVKATLFCFLLCLAAIPFCLGILFLADYLF